MQLHTTSLKSDFLSEDKDKERSTYFFLGKKRWYTKSQLLVMAGEEEIFIFRYLNSFFPKKSQLGK